MKDMEINFSLTDSSGETFKFTSFRSLCDFCTRERDFWAEKLQLLEKNRIGTNAIPDQFTAAKHLMKLAVTVDRDTFDSDESYSKEVQNRIRKLYHDNVSSHVKKWLYSGHPYTENFIDLHLKYGLATAEAFLQYIQNRENWLPREMKLDHIKGYIAGYEFKNHESDLITRRKSEHAARSKITKEFAESKDQLFGEVAALKKDYEKIFTETRQEVVKELEELQALRATNVEKVEHSIIQYEKSVSDSIDAQEAEFQAFKEESRSRIRAIEETYEERLRLEPAAKYWKASASRLRKQGVFFVALIASTVGAGLLAGIDLFETWLSHEKLPIDLTSLQGVVITITVLAIYAYILRLLSRLTFSSFHLMRDAEEREQLTYLYLALSNETDVDEKSREIVLQALFSRSETGLLTNEHGPVMPGMDLNLLLKGMGR
jgi:hypothetical protein